MRWTAPILFLLFSSSIWGDNHIFLFHRFDDPKHPSTSVSTKQLRKDFQYLKEHGYRVVSLDYLIHHMNEDKLVAFTIDDGYESFYLHGFKLFREFGYPFTIFIYTEAIDSEYSDFMDWVELRYLAKFGEIAIHSYNHSHLTHLEPIEVMRDTQRAIEIFKKNMGYPPKYYSYPYGEYDKDVRDIIEAFGFDAIFNQSIGAVNSESDIYNLNRIPLLGKYDIRKKLKIRFLPVEWFQPHHYPKDGKLKRVIAKVPENLKKVQLYISGYGWRVVPVDNGIVDIEFQKPIKLKYRLTRLFIRTFDNRWNGNLIVK